MADPDKPGAKTTEFLLTLLANALGSIAASGLVTDDVWVKRLGIASIIVANALYTWQRTMLKRDKVAADAPPVPAPQSSPAVVNAPVLAVAPAPRDGQSGKSEFVVLVVFTITACCVFASTALVHGCSSVKGAAHDVASSIVDCTKGATANTVHDLRPLGDAMLSNALADGKVDWGPVRDVAKGFATDVGRCVLADAVSRALAPRKADPNAPKLSPLDVDQDALRAGFRQLSGELYGGASFKTEAGAL